jgi:hypothetical protein
VEAFGRSARPVVLRMSLPRGTSLCARERLSFLRGALAISMFDVVVFVAGMFVPHPADKKTPPFVSGRDTNEPGRVTCLTPLVRCVCRYAEPWA